MSTSETNPTATSEGRAVLRAGAVVVAVLAALGLWAITQHAIGMDLQTPGFGSEQPQDLTVAPVIVVSALAGILGWGLLVVLERTTRHPRRVWATVALAALVISLGGPLSGTGISDANRVVLAGLHLVVAAVLIWLLGRTAGDPR